MWQQQRQKINSFFNVSTVDLEQSVCLLNYYFETINMFWKAVENKTWSYNFTVKITKKYAEFLLVF